MRQKRQTLDFGPRRLRLESSVKKKRDQSLLLLAFPFLAGKGGARKLTQRLATQGDISGDYDLVCEAVN